MEKFATNFSVLSVASNCEESRSAASGFEELAKNELAVGWKLPPFIGPFMMYDFRWPYGWKLPPY